VKAFVSFCRNEPVRAMSILNALIVLAVAFGAHLTTPQISAIIAFAAVILGIGGEIVRAQVTPTPIAEAALTLPPGSSMADAKAKVAAEQKAVAAVDAKMP